MTRVLLVDDSRLDRMIHRRWLEDAAISVTEASGVEAGIALALETPFDCVLMDYVMPHGDGLHGIHAMRAQVPDCPPIILLTCAPNDEMQRNAIALGAAHCMTKPLMRGNHLIEAIQDAVSGKQAAIAELTALP